jgi:DNA-binding MarR family transcriptional regulator
VNLPETQAELEHPADIVDVTSRMRFATTRLARLLRQQSDSGLSPTLVAALATIARRGPLTLGALAEIERVAPPTITKVVDKLAEAGLAQRQSDQNDRRVVRVEVTPDGQAMLHEVRARKDAWLATRLAELSETDLALIGAALPVLESLIAASADERRNQ